VIELRLLPPGFTGFDLMPSRDQIRAVAQDVVPALRAPAQRPQPRRWPDGAPATLRPGPWPHPATAISPANQAPEATRAASWRERPVRRTRTGEKYRLSAPLPAAGPTRGTREPHRWCEDQSPRQPESCAWAKWLPRPAGRRPGRPEGPRSQ